MTYPPSLTLITLTGQFLDGTDDGDGREGVVKVTLAVPIRSTGDNVIIPPFQAHQTLNVDGSFSMVLPALTDPDWIPNTAEYIVEAIFTFDYTKLWWSVPFPWDTPGATIDLADCGTPNVGTPSSTILTGTSTTVVPDGGYKGLWSGGAVYRVGDTVEHSGGVYGALRPSSGITPGTDGAVWSAYPGGGGGGSVLSVFGRSGNVVAQAGDYTKTQVGLGNVDNTSDVGKPVSTAQADADTAILASAQVYVDTGLSTKAPLAGPAFTGTATAVNLTVSGRQLNTPVALTPAASVAVNAALGNDFTLVADQDFTLANPTNPSAGQKILFAIRQDGTGSRVMTLGSAFRLGTDISSVVLTTAANKTDYLGVRYNATDAKWDVLAFVKGY